MLYYSFNRRKIDHNHFEDSKIKIHTFSDFLTSHDATGVSFRKRRFHHAKVYAIVVLTAVLATGAIRETDETNILTFCYFLLLPGARRKLQLKRENELMMCASTRCIRWNVIFIENPFAADTATSTNEIGPTVHQ